MTLWLSRLIGSTDEIIKNVIKLIIWATSIIRKRRLKLLWKGLNQVNTVINKFFLSKDKKDKNRYCMFSLPYTIWTMSKWCPIYWNIENVLKYFVVDNSVLSTVPKYLSENRINIPVTPPLLKLLIIRKNKIQISKLNK